MMENYIPEIHIFLKNNTWNEMIESAQIKEPVKKKKFSTEANMKFINKKYINLLLYINFL